MKRYFVLLCGLLLCANSIRAELVSVKLYQDPEQNADYIKKEYTGNQENLAACWDGQFLQLNKSDNTGSASITFSAPSYTVINSYSFLVFSNNIKHKPTYQINDDEAVSPTGDLKNPNTVQKSDYSTQTLKITTKIERVLGFFQYNYYYVRMKQFDFTILIPEVQSGQQTTTTTLTKLSNADLAGGTKTRIGNLSFYVKDPIDTSDPTKYFAAEIVEPTDASEKSHWSVATSGWSIKETGKTETVNGRTVKIYEVVVPVTYNAGASPVVGTYSATVRLSSRNDRNTTTADQMAQITVGDVKAENPLDWRYTWENNGTVSFYKGDIYQRTDYLVNTAGQILEIPQSSNADVVYIEPLNGNIVAKSEGTAVITYTQPETEMYKEKKLTLTVTVVKHTPAFTIYSEERDGDKYVFYVNKSYSPFISTTNTDLSDYPISVTHNAAQYIEIDNLDAQTKSNVATFDVTISQAEGDLWYEKTETFTIELRHNPIHVGTLCDRTLEEKFADNRFSIDKNNNAVYRDGAIFLGSTAGGSNGGSITFHFVGTPDKLEITTATSSGSPSWTYKQSKTEYDADFYDLKNFTFDDDARYLKVIVSGSQAVGKITALCITERVGVSVSPIDVSLIAVDNTVSAGKLNVSIINLETVSLKVSGENAEDFKLVCGTHSYTSQSGLTLDYTDGLGIDCSPVVPVEIQYVGDYASAVGKTAQVDITDGNDHTATVSVKIQSIAQNEYGVPSFIYASMATTTGIETGTEHKTNNNHPYHLKKAVNLTGAFAGGAACFDKLYIFGVTKGYTSAGAETTTVNQTYSKTPCYVYAKNGDHYDFEQYVENMNSDTKGIGVDVAANGQKLYFTGWCPYASAGYLPSDIGAFHIKGGAGAKVDVYLDNCFLFVRDKTVNHKVDADETQAETKFGNYPMGSGGAFVFETTSTNSGSPFSPMVHLRGENILRSTHGNRVYVSFVGQVKTATQISSPIHMYTTSTSQYETLTIDDKWPTNAAGTETENVNGSLRLTKKTSNSPSIDLGNGNSVVNFNGGQVHLQNALPMSVAYSSTMAISWRSYSQYGLTIYGIGTDQASGEVNFNDGTISATPIDQTAWSASTAEAYKGYYWDNESMKCPKNTHINGGSYNCNVWACSSFDDKGSSVTDCKGTSLCKKRIKITGVEENGMAIFDFPYSESGDDGQTLESYYKNNGFLYGHNSITADEKDSVNLMLPCSYIGSEAVVSKLVIPWAMCVPALAAGAGNNASKTFGGDITVLNDETHEISNFVWTRIDGNMEDIIDGGNYTSPEYGATIKFQGNPHDYSQVENAEYYTIQNDLHIIMPAVADNWMTFTAPFDVKKIYVLESYPDSILQEKTREEALKLQATANVDFAYFLAFNVLGVEPMSTSPLSGLYNSWLSYEYGQDTLATGFLKKDDKGKWLSRANYEKKYRGKRELVAYDGTNGAKANFYAYTAGDTWQLKGNAVEPNWRCIDIGEDGVLFKKGQTYSLLFPYCVGCWTEAEKIDGRNYWDYWSGKLLIFEGDGPQTVYGKNHQNDLLSATAATNTVSISGNSTFADMTSSSKDIWTFGNGIGDESFAANTDGYKNFIEPATAFLINGIQSKAGAAPKRINLRSGAVTYENGTDDETSVPTIAGGHSLIVNSVAGGVEVIPVEAQQVSVYGAAGQLIVSDYLTDETTLSLPAGIYIIRGEKEMVKVVVR